MQLSTTSLILGEFWMTVHVFGDCAYRATSLSYPRSQYTIGLSSILKTLAAIVNWPQKEHIED